MTWFDWFRDRTERLTMTLHGRFVSLPVLAFTAALAQAAGPGNPDPRFNDGAPVLVDCARSSIISHCAFHALAADANGGLLVAGEGSDEDGRIGLALVRLRDDGTLDTSFGTAGSVVMQLGLGLTAFAPFSRGVAIGSRPDDAGWIVLGSATVDDGSSAALAAAFDPTGNLDPAYAVGGSLRHQVGGPMAFMPTSASGGAIDADGSAFLTGGTDGKLVLVKVTATGQYEASYVGDFSETAAAGSGGHDAFVTHAGTLVAGWTNDENGQRQVLLVRFTSALALDPTFGGGTGFVRLQIADPHTPTRESVGSAVAVGPASEIYVAGRASDAAGMAVMRFSSSGIPDAAFGSDGIRRVQTAGAGGVSLAEDIVVQPDGRVLVVGTSSRTVGVVETAILRLDIHGDLDPTFGSGGIVRISGVATAAAITLDGTALTVAGAASRRPVVSPGFVARVLLTTRCDLPSPSLVGARCRVSLLEETVMSSVPAGKLKRRLTAALDRIATLLDMASNTSDHAFRRKLRKARVSARRVRHLLNSTAAMRSIPAEVRASLVAEAGPIPREIGALIEP